MFGIPRSDDDSEPQWIIPCLENVTAVCGKKIGKGPFQHIAINDWEQMNAADRWNTIGPCIFNNWQREFEISTNELDIAHKSQVSVKFYIAHFTKPLYHRHIGLNLGYIFSGNSTDKDTPYPIYVQKQK